MFFDSWKRHSFKTHPLEIDCRAAAAAPGGLVLDRIADKPTETHPSCGRMRARQLGALLLVACSGLAPAFAREEAPIGVDGQSAPSHEMEAEVARLREQAQLLRNADPAAIRSHIPAMGSRSDLGLLALADDMERAVITNGRTRPQSEWNRCDRLCPEARMERALRRLARDVEINTVLDVGANKGSWAEELLTFVLPQAKVVLVEANDNENLRALAQRRGLEYHNQIVW